MRLEMLKNSIIVIPCDTAIVNIEDAKKNDEAYLFTVVEIDAPFEGANRQLVFASSLKSAERILLDKNRLLHKMVIDGHLDYGNDKVPVLVVSKPDTRLIGREQWMPIIIKR